MARPSSKVQTGASVDRNKEMKLKEDFATGNYTVDDLLLPGDIKKREANELVKANEEKLQSEKPKNFDINFLSDEIFDTERVYLPYKAHSDLILLIGPKINTKTSLVLSPDQKNEMIKNQLDKLGQGFRVLKISQKARMQNMAQVTTAESNTPLTLEEFKVGDYVFFNAAITVLHDMKPFHDHLMYFQVRNMDIRFSMTQEDALKFKPEVKD